MRGYVAITDLGWYEHLAWRPQSTSIPRAVTPVTRRSQVRLVA